MLYVSPRDRFHVAITVLSKYFDGDLITRAINNLLHSHPLPDEPYLRSILYGLYLHQDSYIPKAVSEHNFTEQEIVLMQTVAQLCRCQPYQFSASLFIDRLCTDLNKLTIYSQLTYLQMSINLGTSFTCVKAALTEPILLALFCFLYIPNNLESQLALLSKLEAGAGNFFLQILAELLSKILAPCPVERHNLGDRLWYYWRGNFE